MPLNTNCQYCVLTMLSYNLHQAIKESGDYQHAYNVSEAQDEHDRLLRRIHECNFDPRCPNCPNPVNHGVSSTDDTTSYVWALFDRKKMERLYPNEETRVGVMLRNFSYGYYGGPGRSFCHSPSVRVSRNYILVKQLRGLDI